MIALLHNVLGQMAVQSAVLQTGTAVKRRFGNHIGRHRRGNNQKQADHQLLNTETVTAQRMQPHPCHQNTANPQRGGLGRCVQAGIKIRQVHHAQRAGHNKHTAHQQSHRCNQFKPEHRQPPSYSMMSPRNRYLASAAVLTKPSMAISRAASKYISVAKYSPSNTIRAMLLMYMVSSARMRSAVDGPISNRTPFSTSAIPTSSDTTGNTTFSIRKSPAAALHNAF